MNRKGVVILEVIGIALIVSALVGFFFTNGQRGKTAQVSPAPVYYVDNNCPVGR
jgi:hypothetical protein